MHEEVYVFSSFIGFINSTKQVISFYWYSVYWYRVYETRNRMR
jgi:hypothetical protein